MKKAVLILAAFYYSMFICNAQEIPPATEQQLENLTDVDQAETEDDSYLVQLDHFKKHPLNLNKAGADELKELIFLTGLQIDNLVLYRNLLGNFISIFELQSIPGWDITTIKKIVPYVTVASAITVTEDMAQRLKGGDHGFMIRYSQTIEKAEGFDHSLPGTKYLGDRGRLFFRYRYQYKNCLQYGLVADKDAGEKFLKGAQKYGFDFYSFHLFIRQVGKIQALALGDFTVNMGQGLIQWQSLAFKKSSDVLGIKRQSAILRPYNSSGEFYFNRGAGATVQFGKIEVTGFVSVRRLSANFVADTVHTDDFVSSFQNSGYHRTQNEVDDRNNMRQVSMGGNVTYKRKKWHVGMNTVSYIFSLPIQKRDEPYNLYAISGRDWSNFSMDYSYSYGNVHFFGEAALDKNLNKAFVNGLLISVDPRVDLSFLHRSISKKYQAVYGNAFTENAYPANENGLYAGLSIRPLPGWRIDLYADFYKFPWLKYLVDAPSYGKDFLVQMTYTPNKQLDIYSRFRSEAKESNEPDNTTVTNNLVLYPRQSWRTHINFKLDRTITLRSRVEVLWYDQKGKAAESGFLTYFDIVYKPMLKPFSGIIRVQYFETDGYNSRLYAYENDVLYSYSIPTFFGKGFRYYINVSYDLDRNLSVWARWAQTRYRDNTSIGTGLDEIHGSHRSEVKIQLMWSF